MDKNSLFRLAGWSAYVSAAATIVGAVTLVIFFSVGDPYGKINDVSSIIIAITGIIVLIAMRKFHRSASYSLSVGASTLGIVALLVAGIVQIVFVAGRIQYEQTEFVSPLGFGLFGIALIVFGYLGWIEASRPRVLSAIGMTAGLGYVLVAAGFILGGPNHMLTYIGGALSVIAYPVWGFWLGCIWLRNAKA